MWRVVTLADVTGWVATALVAGAASVPLGHRIVRGRRAALDSRPIRSHVAIGIAVCAAAFVHILTVIPELGTSTAIDAGMSALAPGALAFLLLLAHVGVGLQLRSPKLKDRPKKRRLHFTFATMIAIVVAAHVVIIMRAG
jgi:formate-dependent nitrite reductase membrane component NrfD